MGLFPARSALVLAGVLTIAGTFAVGPALNADATPATTGDFSGLVDIGGRSISSSAAARAAPRSSSKPAPTAAVTSGAATICSPPDSGPW